MTEIQGSSELIKRLLLPPGLTRRLRDAADGRRPSTRATAEPATSGADFDSRTWQARPQLNLARGGLDVATVGGRILAIGGFASGFSRFFNEVESRSVN